MTKKKLQKTNAERILEKNKIAYEPYEFPWSEDHLDAIAVANILGVSEERIYKTLVAKGNVTGPIVAVIVSFGEVDLKKLAKLSGNKKVEMLPLKELEQTTGYIRGGCSPIGMKRLYPTFIDKNALELSKIIVSAGKRGMQIELKPEELAKVVKGKFGDLLKV